MYFIIIELSFISWTISHDKGVDQSKAAGAAQVCLSVAVHEDLLATVAGGLSSACECQINVSDLQDLGY